jgi:predicted Fe-Mo cluster-binding NifX family protein
MKICITSRGSDLDSLIDPHFGRAQNFIFLNEKGEIEEVLKNPGVEAMRGAGISAAQMIADKRVSVVITGNVGPNAFKVLSPSGIKIFLVDINLTVKEVFSLFNEGKIKELNMPSVQGHFGQGPFPGGRGRGQGRGFGGRR